MRKNSSYSYSSLISIESLFQAWEEFRKGKKNKKDVQVFERHLEDNLFFLLQKLVTKSYKHGPYEDFFVHDPKQRHIHKAQVADRVVHHLLYKFLYQLFDRIFICDSYSCRLEKGTHRAVKRLEKFTRTVSKNYNRSCFALKCDIRRFFDCVDHAILANLISKKIEDKDILWLLDQVVSSFHSGFGQGKGIPLGNLTSQIFANIYLNELDQFVKHKLKIKYYFRYADDFVILNSDSKDLYRCIDTLKQFLLEHLKIELHPGKIVIRKLSWGIDYCGYVVLPHYRLSRTKTKRRIFRKALTSQVSSQSLQSYLGYFSHANAYQVEQNLKNLFFLKI